jgi:hypothetical protein
MHCRVIGRDFPVHVITIPALTVGAFVTAWVSWWRVDVRLTEKTSCLDERDRELA